MKQIVFFIIIIMFSFSCKTEHKKHNQEQTTSVSSKKKVLSPHTSVMEIIGNAHIHIDYSSPGVRDRIIFGGLLAYDQVWQAGAHNATWLETNKDLEINKTILPAGKYGFFTIPSKNKWTLIFNSNWNQHGKDEYDEKDDIIRLKVKPTFLEENVEHLKYEINKTNDESGEIKLSWEKITVKFNFNVK
ncbi:DUF2911 domain-containing protein [Tenacibaculum sp. ZS6-P6]|uniref:DUF2911 domain-containing protein n=1 Tax=Tenacibaculum sp. ZS6-P6 TaxID=3447503 RepID=UPI003F9A158D